MKPGRKSLDLLRRELKLDFEGTQAELDQAEKFFSGKPPKSIERVKVRCATGRSKKVTLHCALSTVYGSEASAYLARAIANRTGYVASVEQDEAGAALWDVSRLWRLSRLLGMIPSGIIPPGVKQIRLFPEHTAKKCHEESDWQGCAPGYDIWLREREGSDWEGNFIHEVGHGFDLMVHAKVIVESAEPTAEFDADHEAKEMSARKKKRELRRSRFVFDRGGFDEASLAERTQLTNYAQRRGPIEHFAEDFKGFLLTPHLFREKLPRIYERFRKQVFAAPGSALREFDGLEHLPELRGVRRQVVGCLEDLTAIRPEQMKFAWIVTNQAPQLTQFLIKDQQGSKVMEAKVTGYTTTHHKQEFGITSNQYREILVSCTRSWVDQVQRSVVGSPELCLLGGRRGIEARIEALARMRIEALLWHLKTAPKGSSESPEKLHARVLSCLRADDAGRSDASCPGIRRAVGD